MKKRIKEETIIFVSVFKWIVLATAVGVITGVSTTVFVSAINFGSLLGQKYPYYYFLMPLGLLLSAVIIKYIFPSAEGHGADKAIEAIHKRSGKISPLEVPVEFIRTFLTLTFGGSAGKEGPSAQIGAGLASLLADALRFEGADRRKLVICGISGAFASVFGTPLAGAIFGMEVLFVGSILYDVLLPSFVAGVISYQVSSWLGLTYFYNPLTFVPVFSEAFFIKVLIAGVFFGVVSLVFVETLKFGKRLSSLIRAPLELKAVLAGAVMAAITYVIGREYLGLGLETLQSALEGGEVPWYAFLMKSIFTGATLGFGGHGGIGTPIFYVGATAGSALSKILSVDPSVLSAIGFVSLLAGAANTPIAASIMAVELFGPAVAPYAAIASVISFVVTGHRSAYPSQVLAIKKSTSIDIELGAELKEVVPQYQQRDGSLISYARLIWELAKRIKNKK